MGTLRAVLFDSGGVLMHPIGGRWNPPAFFESVVAGFRPGIEAAEFEHAVAVADQFHHQSPASTPYDEYYRVLLGELRVDDPEAVIEVLNRPWEPSSLLELYPEVISTLDELRRRGVLMAVVSDASPNLPNLHAGLGIHDFFEVYAISAVLGCTKPDPRMYRHASDGLGLAPHECLFVDDVAKLVAAAIDLGYEGRVVRRHDTDPQTTLPAIATIDELLELF